MQTIEQQLAALATMSPAQLRAEWRRLHRGQSLPAGLVRSQLERSIAWRLQERAWGGLSAADERELDRLARELETTGQLELPASRRLKPGAQLVRRWQGKTYVVHVLEEGFAFDGRVYKSLTHIARDITGAAWSGPRFFGLKRAGLT